MAIDEETIRVLVIDDHEIFARSLARTLSDEPDLDVCEPSTTPADAKRRIGDVDVAVCDFRIGDETGTSLARELLDLNPTLRIVMLTASHDATILARALEAGCTGFVTKSEPLETVLTAIRAAAIGEAIITPSLLAEILPRIAPVRRGPNTDLTEREREVLTLICQGMSNQQIADELILARDTIRNHVAAILSKLGVRSKLQAAAVAYQRRLVNLP